MSCSNKLQFYFLLCMLCFSSPVPANGLFDPDINGHIKYQFQAAGYPSHSIYRQLYGDNSKDHLLDTRLKLSAREQAFDFQVDYQLQALHGDRLRSSQFTAGPDFAQPYPEDDRRLFDLTKVVSDSDDTAVLHRLDRFNLAYTNPNTVIRVGRQVLSWGNGLMFNPVDFFNPFDPAALDTEYKIGDDMLFGQHLLQNGDDIQAVIVGRRDERDSVSANHSSAAFKYHAWLDSWLEDSDFFTGAELEMLLAQHFDDDIVAAGLVKSLGGAVWRSDLMFTRTQNDTVLSAVANVSYSWIWGNTNFSGVAEYYYNGFGLSDGDYTLQAIQQDADLQARLTRGELYTIGRHYLGLSATIELTPLWLATPVLLMNLDDQSALLQLGIRHSLAQDWQLIGALNVPLGPKNTEYGGIKTEIAEGTLATRGGLFAQLAFYF